MTPNPQQMQLMLMLRAISGRRQQQPQGLVGQSIVKNAEGKNQLGGKGVYKVRDTITADELNPGLIKALGLEDLYKREYTPSSYQHDSYVDSKVGPELQKALQRYSSAELHFGKDMRQAAYIDKETGKVVHANDPRQYRGLKGAVKTVAPLALAAFGGPLATGLGSSLGLTGGMASAVGGGLLSGGTTALMGGKGSDIFKSMALGGLGSGIGAYGQSAGWNPALTKIAARTVPGLVTGKDPRQLLMSAALGQFNPTPNAGFNNLMRTIIGRQLMGGRG